MRNPRILIVEDNEVIADLEKLILEKEPYEVEITGDCFEAMERIKNKEYDVIISDFTMPKMRGDQFYSELEKIGQGLEKRIIFVTGFINDFIESTGNRYILKPFPNKLFLEQVKEFISDFSPQTVGAK